MIGMLIGGVLGLAGLIVFGVLGAVFALLFGLLVLPFKLLGFALRGVGFLIALPFLFLINAARGGSHDTDPVR